MSKSLSPLQDMPSLTATVRQKAVHSSNFNGEVTRKEPDSATYTVKADCTGTVTFRDGSKIDVFIAPDGSKFTFVRTQALRARGVGFRTAGECKAGCRVMRCEHSDTLARDECDVPP